MESRKATLYVDNMSQPARSLIIFCRAAGIDHELKKLRISNGDQRSPEYKRINPLGKIPSLQEGDFTLPEAAAILRYLATTRRVADHWYPADPRQRAVVDSALDWHHGNVRRGAGSLLVHRVLFMELGVKPSEVVARESLFFLRQALQLLETVWLVDRPFVAGQHISIADLLMAPELEQLRLLQGASVGPTMPELMEPVPKVRAWMARVAHATAPHYDVVHATLLKSEAFRKKQKDERERAKL